MKKIIILFLILITTGCTSYTELSDLTIVNTLGIDYKDKFITYMKTSNNNNLSSSNSSLKQSINNIYLTSNKKLYLSHINLLILTEEAINNKLDEILYNFLSDNKFRNNFDIIIMNSNELDEFFKSKYTSKDIIQLININQKETSAIVSIELEEFIKQILIDNNHYIPTISFKDNKLEITGYTLIKNKKVYKQLSTKENIILNILSNKFNQTYINNLTIYSGNTSIKTINNNITFTINLLTDNKNTTNLKKDIDNFINKYQREVDILNINNLIMKNHYSYYKNTNKIDIEYKIIINPKIKENYIKVTKHE